MIRAATPEDASAIAQIWNPVIRDTLITFTSIEQTDRSLRAVLSGKAKAGLPFLVVDGSSRIEGFATYGQFRGGNGYAHAMEHTVIVSPQAHRQGLGRKLMRRIEQHAKEKGAHTMIAGISAENPAAVQFHAAIGYLHVARLAEVGRKQGRWLDLVLMQKLLT